MTLTRRALLRGTAAAAALGLTGCSGLTPGRDTSGSLDYWNLFGGGDGVRMQTMEAAYAAQQGGPSSLQAATFTWGNPYYTKVTLAPSAALRPMSPSPT